MESIRYIFWFFLTVLLTGCGGGSSSGEKSKATPIESINSKPVTTFSQSIKLNEDTPAAINLEKNEIVNAIYKVMTPPEHGTLLGTPPYTVYVPNKDFQGIDKVVFTITNEKGETVPISVDLHINGTTKPIENIAPVAISYTVKIDEDTAVVLPMVATDKNKDNLSFTYTQPAHGTYNGSLYRPNANYYGRDSFTYIANDGKVDSKRATVAITVTPVNDRPVVKRKSVSVVEDGQIEITLLGADIDGDPLTYSYTQPQHGSFDGKIYKPNANYFGIDHFYYTANDGKLTSRNEMVTINVTGENDAPIAQHDRLNVNANTSISLTLKGSDVDGDLLSYTILSMPKHGMLSGTAPHLTYTPDKNYEGSDSITFKVNDGKVDSEVGVVSIVVMAKTVALRGRVTYDYVPGVATHRQREYKLDYTAIVKRPVRKVIVELVDNADNVLETTTTDNSGNYQFFGIPYNKKVKVRVLAKMYKQGLPSWDVKVVDNTQDNILYAIEGSLASVGESDSRRDLHARSGWSNGSYTTIRAAAPFAILDTIDATMHTVLSVDKEIRFPPLQVNWSINNKAIAGDITKGEIGTSYYFDGNLYILGDADSDTDEYDSHIIAHEWGHYYEENFSRTDNIGGMHGEDALLDIRVAFSEGWGNAFSAIALKDPLYYDTYGEGQATGWGMDIEHQPSSEPGWFNEASVQHIIYDLWDSSNDKEDDDALALGFSPIHRVLSGPQRETMAFTSIFSFIKLLKDQNPLVSDEIDTVVNKEHIATIDDIYGGILEGSTPRSNHASEYPYRRATINGEATPIHLSIKNGIENRLGNRAYIVFTIEDKGWYVIRVKQTNGDNSDPMLWLYQMPATHTGWPDNSSSSSIEEYRIYLQVGNYLLDVMDQNSIGDVDYDVTIQAD